MTRVVLAAAVVSLATAIAGETMELSFENPQAAGISGLRPFWDRPVVLREDGALGQSERGNTLRAPQAIWANDLAWHQHLDFWFADKKRAGQPRLPGPLVFDAVHRSVLVRFPGAAQRLADALDKGFAVAKAELLLPFKDTEKMPRGYKEPTSFIGTIWDTNPPRWHAVAWALRRPWAADPETGPTFNAAVNGAAFWSKYGAQDTEHDRFPQQFGPAEVSFEKSEALDVTAALIDAAFGKTLAERLRTLEDCGFLVRKQETYDMHFATPGYEWASMTGGRGVFVHAPRLVVTLRSEANGPKVGQLPPAPDLAALNGGAPTAKMPSPEEFEKLRALYGFQRPDPMPEWQWKRVAELYQIGGKANTFPDTMEDCEKWIDGILATEPRRWEGFQAADQLTLFYLFEKALPPPVVDHWRLFWTAWLNPHMDTKDMVHNQYHQIWTKWRGVGSDYVDRTGDWRGNSSFYRESYCRIISTMNFNHTAALGALLGGRFIGSERAMADGRFGLEHFPLRLWAWYDGTTQESIDHYYFAITLQAQKMFADFAPTRFDRMMGESILLKSVEELAGCYHPGLRRFVSTSSRTGIAYPLKVQDGLQHILHTLSRRGTLTDLDKLDEAQKDRKAIPVIGHDLPPRQVAMRTLSGPWAPDWMAEIVDEKPLPFEMVTTFRQWGAFLAEPRWKKSYLGPTYGLASIDLGNNVIQAMALWRRCEGEVTSSDQLGLLLVKYGFNRTNLLDTHMGGVLGTQGGGTAILQHRNKMIVLASPYKQLQSHGFNPAKTEIKSLQTTIGLLTVQAKPTWVIAVNEKPLGSLPAKVASSARIAIHDGPTYIGILPIAATNLGRDAEVALHAGGEPVKMQGGGEMTEGLVIENYNYRSDTPLDQAKADWDRIDAAYGGFVVELGDASEFSSFEAFQNHLARTIRSYAVTEAGELQVGYKSGKDTFELTYRPALGDGPDSKLPGHAYFRYRRVNGKWPYLPEGIERETPLSVQGRRGRLEKCGATLTVEPGQMGYLLAEPKTGTFLAANPLPDPTYLRLELPGGVKVEADGKLGLARIVVRPAESKVWVDYAVRDDQSGDDMATALVVSGLKGAPQVIRNGQPAAAVTTVAGHAMTVIPLLEDLPKGALHNLPARCAAAKAAAERAFAAPKAAEQAVLRYEGGQEDYLLTKPRSGAWAFQRLWPGGTVFTAKVPGGLRVASDGRVALRRLVLDPRQNRIEVDAPLYLQVNFEDKAKALLVFGAKEAPVVELNGETYKGKMPAVTVAGEPAWLVPLFGASPDEASQGIGERWRAAAAKLSGN